MTRSPRIFVYALLLAALVAGPAFAQSAAPQQAPKQSVKPGINETWKSPNIQPLVATLEAESREIYREREKLAALVGLQPGMAVADVGAGSGFMVEIFAKLVGLTGKAYAVDINPKLLERIAQQASEQGLKNLQTVLAKDDSAELPPNSVDVVFICDTYHHFEYPQGTMASLHRALRPGGQLIIVDFKRVPGVSPAWVLDHVRAGQEVFTKEIVEAGFEVVRGENASFLTENYVLRFRKMEKPQALLVPRMPFSAGGLAMTRRVAQTYFGLLEGAAVSARAAAGGAKPS